MRSLFESMNEDLNCLDINGNLIRFYMYDNIICFGITNLNFNLRWKRYLEERMVMTSKEIT